MLYLVFKRHFQASLKTARILSKNEEIWKKEEILTARYEAPMGNFSPLTVALSPYQNECLPLRLDESRSGA